jgi:hypothetical protein
MVLSGWRRSRSGAREEITLTAAVSIAAGEKADLGLSGLALAGEVGGGARKHRGFARVIWALAGARRGEVRERGLDVSDDRSEVRERGLDVSDDRGDASDDRGEVRERGEDARDD